IKYEGKEQIKLKDKVNGKFVNIKLNSGDEVAITNPALNVLQIENLELPKHFALFQNSPHPFNPKTVLKFALPIKSNVKITIYNITGESITNLLDKELEAGYHEINFDASNLPSGIYIYTMTTNSFYKSMKMAVIK
ncbi:MAG: T9SS type A sorting domain-containing protein, partial [Ignavibacteria bacterium]|nr:T9SS type A sorting domain-containing protein [Ignavibacteria bacterium]